MNNLNYKASYRRHLPHLQPKGATFFVTVRLVDTVPKSVQKQWRMEKEWLAALLPSLPSETEKHFERLQFHRRRFAELEAFLHKGSTGPHWLQNPMLATIVCENLRYFDGVRYRLDAFCVMSNHFHVLLKPLQIDGAGDSFQPLQRIMHSLKRYSALKCNQLLARTGQFWESESFDHYIRNEKEQRRVLRYILQNPVKAGIVRDWQEYPFLYCSEEAQTSINLQD